MKKCGAPTRNNKKPCRKYPVPGKPHCHLHLPSYAGEVQDPWPTHLPPPSPLGVKRLRKLWCKTEFPVTDHSGFLYCYRLEGDADGGFYKIGYTERDISTRLREWSDGGRLDPRLVVGIFVRHCKHAERLAFAWLEDARVYRYPLEITPKGDLQGVYYYNEWKNASISTTPLPNGKGVVEKPTHESVHKQVEWVYGVSRETLHSLFLAIAFLKGVGLRPDPQPHSGMVQEDIQEIPE